MFERFTERARQVVVLAQDEARALGLAIGTEHILLEERHNARRRASPRADARAAGHHRGGGARAGRASSVRVTR